MSNAVKWALLAAAAVAAIALIVALPFTQFANAGQLSAMLIRLVQIVGGAFTSARGLVNNFLTPFGRTVLTGLLYYLFGKFFITIAIRVSAWVYHFIFRG